MRELWYLSCDTYARTLCPTKVIPGWDTATHRTKILDFRGFDPSIILSLRGGISRPVGNLPESLRQRILVWRFLVERLAVGYSDPRSAAEPGAKAVATSLVLKLPCLELAGVSEADADFFARSLLELCLRSDGSGARSVSFHCTLWKYILRPCHVKS